MTSRLISKRSDPFIRRLRKMKDDPDPLKIFIEGEKLLIEAFTSNIQIDHVFLEKGKEKRSEAILRKYKFPKDNVFVLKPEVMSFLSGLKTPSGCLAVGAKPDLDFPFESYEKEDLLVLVIHKAQLPENVGALVRTAEAAGVNEIWLTPDTANPFSLRGIRASAGSVFRVPIKESVPLGEALNRLKLKGVRAVGASTGGSVLMTKFDWTRRVALVLGTEGAGFTKGELALFDQTIEIPMKGNVESLNIGVAGAVCLFEALRQRANQ